MCLFYQTVILIFEDLCLSWVESRLFYLKQLFSVCVGINFEIQTNLKHEDFRSCWVFGYLAWMQKKGRTFFKALPPFLRPHRNSASSPLLICFNDLIRSFQLDWDIWPGMCICEQVIPWRIIFYLWCLAHFISFWWLFLLFFSCVHGKFREMVWMLLFEWIHRAVTLVFVLQHRLEFPQCWALFRCAARASPCLGS